MIENPSSIDKNKHQLRMKHELCSRSFTSTDQITQMLVSGLPESALCKALLLLYNYKITYHILNYRYEKFEEAYERLNAQYAQWNGKAFKPGTATH